MGCFGNRLLAYKKRYSHWALINVVAHAFFMVNYVDTISSILSAVKVRIKRCELLNDQHRFFMPLLQVLVAFFFEKLCGRLNIPK